MLFDFILNLNVCFFLIVLCEIFPFVLGTILYETKILLRLRNGDVEAMGKQRRVLGDATSNN